MGTPNLFKLRHTGIQFAILSFEVPSLSILGIGIQLPALSCALLPNIDEVQGGTMKWSHLSIGTSWAWV